MKFKTNAMCMGCVAAIRRSIGDITNPADWELISIQMTRL